MFITILKFLHIIVALGLMGVTLYCFVAVGSKRFSAQPTRLLLSLSLIAIVTGTFLVYPRHFNFHTHWIQAAYVLALLFAALLMIQKNKLSVISQRVIYLVLIVVLIAIAHDAVTKSTFLF